MTNKTCIMIMQFYSNEGDPMKSDKRHEPRRAFNCEASAECVEFELILT